MAQPKSPRRIDGARVRELRADRGWTLTTLAEVSGVADRALSNIERGDSRGSPDTARALAAAFNVDLDTLLVRDAPTPEPTAQPARSDAPAPALPPPKLPARTRLDALADLERALGIDPAPIVVDGKRVPLLTAARLQDAFATHAAFDGHRFVVAGTLDRQRALSAEEARAIGAKVGAGARFHVVWDVAPGEPVGVTVHVATVKLARALQPKMKREVRMVVRLKVVSEEDARVMALFASVRKRSWGFLVEGEIG